MMSCLFISASEEEKGVKVELPERAGSWRVTAVAQPSAPLPASSQPLPSLHVSTCPRPLRVFRPLGVALKVPPTLRVGETLELPVKIVNNIDSCVDVSPRKLFSFIYLRANRGIPPSVKRFFSVARLSLFKK